MQNNQHVHFEILQNRYGSRIFRESHFPAVFAKTYGKNSVGEFRDQIPTADQTWRPSEPSSSPVQIQLLACILSTRKWNP